VLWFCEGRKATRGEVLDSIGSGVPLLRQLAEKDGPPAIEEFDRALAGALELVPA